MDTRAFEEWTDRERYGIDLVDVISDNLPSSVRWMDYKGTQQLVDVNEGGKPVLVIARNAVLR
jgi:hypothetical protein